MKGKVDDVVQLQKSKNWASCNSRQTDIPQQYHTLSLFFSHVKTMACLHRDHTEHEYKGILDQNSFSDLEVNQTKAN